MLNVGVTLFSVIFTALYLLDVYSELIRIIEIVVYIAQQVTFGFSCPVKVILFYKSTCTVLSQYNVNDKIGECI